MKLLASILLLFFTINCSAQIYVKEEGGDIIFSDTPMKDAKTVKLSETEKKPSTPAEISAQANPTQESKEDPIIEAISAYTTFRISSPVDKETIQNQPSLMVTMTTEPALKEGDKIQLFVDGNRVGQPGTSMQIDAGRIDRGAHEVYGQIIDKDNRNVLQSNVITIYIQQAHTGAPKPIPQAAPVKINPAG